MDFLNKFYTYNAYSEVEEVLGEKDKASGRIAVHLHMLNQKEKRDELALRGDTYWSCPFGEGIDVFLDTGFVPVVIRSFDGNTQIIYQHPAGIIASAESELIYRRRNRRHHRTLGRSFIHYNWRPHDWGNNPIQELEYMKYGHVSQGTFYVGRLCAREALKQKIAMLDSAGTLLNPWEKVPFKLDLRHEKDRRNGLTEQEALDIILPLCDLETRRMIGL